MKKLKNIHLGKLITKLFLSVAFYYVSLLFMLASVMMIRYLGASAYLEVLSMLIFPLLIFSMIWLKDRKKVIRYWGYFVGVFFILLFLDLFFLGPQDNMVKTWLYEQAKFHYH